VDVGSNPTSSTKTNKEKECVQLTSFVGATHFNKFTDKDGGSYKPLY